MKIILLMITFLTWLNFYFYFVSFFSDLNSRFIAKNGLFSAMFNSFICNAICAYFTFI
ncbi:Hypothetical protein PAU_03708 [Photorhabdus asymbiotica]|uniref:Uncharacterized protein n=1 Tax=Photorhabdus asymbiotica subsp. asymbiotica (strain ATCC 43949 / 3105-77) TaxID=553480 RepID=C7BLU0_PHOAA|nr:Hypothetical protein PAU_03708 [Photorhabdus asymbiotica]